MALTRTLEQMREATYRFANVQGTTARLRHPESDVNDAINRALGSLYRKLTEASADQRFLASASITTEDQTSTYALESDFEHLISVDLLANGVRTWLHGFEPSDRALLTDPSEAYSGIPLVYRLKGANIELLPTPTDEYTVRVWYVPTVTQFTGDAQTFDTINRLDDYVIAYAARTIATKDKAWDLVAECRNVCNELGEEIAVIGRNRDKNSPPGITDIYDFNRFGRRTHRRWR
jgi:hypothetical protein